MLRVNCQTEGGGAQFQPTVFGARNKAGKKKSLELICRSKKIAWKLRKNWKDDL